MSVLINGIDMPKYESLTIKIMPSGAVCDQYGRLDERVGAVEVPKHGRLVDADALMSTIKEHDYHLYDRLTDTTQPGMFTFGIAYAVCTAQTIIEAEE